MKGTNEDKKSIAHHGSTEKPAKNLEFGGVPGAIFLLLWSHYILFYFWYCYEKYDGRMVLPLTIEELQGHLSGFTNLLMEKGIPSKTTWAAYFSFFVLQLLLAMIMPGMSVYGVPIDDKGTRLIYHCNGYLSYYFCLYGCFFAHFTGLLPLTYYCDHYGQFLVAAMLIGDTTSILWYYLGLFTDPSDTRTGIPLYDFFMGTILYPRIGEVDVKMIAECRWSWLTLMILTLSCASKQYLETGSLSMEMSFMLLAHWLYSNATVKGEQYIPCTWDMFHERFGWMLNFWNVCGVPFLYCYQSFYLLKNQNKITGTRPEWSVALIYILLLFAYYLFDTANSQKATLKMPDLQRNTFPQLPWRCLKKPVRVIKTPHGDLLVDGFYAFARKLQYTGDILMALSWGLICGFGSPLPYFYLMFFLGMIIHRQSRDEVRCKAKYGVYWDIYTKQVPNVFVPSAALITWLFTGEYPPLLDVDAELAKKQN